MRHAEFDETVAGFYQAAAGTIDWVDALQTFQRSISAFAIYVHSTDVTSGRVAYSYNASDLPVEAELDYIRTYHRIDPRARLGMGMPPVAWVNCWDVFDDDFVANDPFYQDFLIPYGGRYVSGGKLIEDASECVILGVHRGIGSAKLDVGEIAACRRLARHLADALLIHRARAAHRHEALLGNALLAKLRAPVALVDDERRILHLNPSAQRFLTESDVLCARGAGCIAAAHPKTRKSLWRCDDCCRTTANATAARRRIGSTCACRAEEAEMRSAWRSTPCAHRKPCRRSASGHW